jgi:hypothetical protein
VTTSILLHSVIFLLCVRTCTGERTRSQFNCSPVALRHQYISAVKLLIARDDTHVRFQVLTAASMKMAVFWVVAPCSLVEVYRRFRGACRLHHQGDKRGLLIALMMETTLLHYKAQQPIRQPSSDDIHVL